MGAPRGEPARRCRARVREVRSPRVGARARAGAPSARPVPASSRVRAVSRRGSAVGRLSARALRRDVLAVAGAVDVDADGMHGEAVEDAGGDGGVTEVAPPFTQVDIGSDGGGKLSVPA